MSNELTVAEKVSALVESRPEIFQAPETSRHREPKQAPVAEPQVTAALAQHDREALQMGAAIAAEQQSLLADAAALQREIDAVRLLATVDGAAARARMGELAGFAAHLERRNLAWQEYAQQFDQRCLVATTWALWRGDEARQERELQAFIEWAVMSADLPPGEVLRIARIPSLALKFYRMWQAETDQVRRPSPGVRAVPRRAEPPPPRRLPETGRIAMIKAAGDILRRAGA